MRALPLDELVRLPEDRALQRHFDARNFRLLRWLLGALGPVAAVATVVYLVERKPAVAGLWGATTLAVLALFLSRETRWFEVAFRQILVVYLAFQLLVFVLLIPEPGGAYALAGHVFPLLLLLFRLRRSEYLVLLAVSLGAAIWSGAIVNATGGATEGGDLGATIGMSVGAAIWTAVLFWAAGSLTRRQERAFSLAFRREAARERERSRMRDELADAREVQLSMLPQETPRLGWVELASVSLPATEVGGDYFDYVELDASRLAIVIGDVAGHGMSSGLMLAALRGGLHLLREELTRPTAVIERLDRMVRELAPRRMYVTLQVALLDAGRRELTLVNAGHPPALLCAADGHGVREIGRGALPLGTGLTTRAQPETVPFATGDVLLLHTDGLHELTDLRGEPLGGERLERALARAAAGSAQEIRQSILDTASLFKGDVALRDDLTFVVAKLLPPPPPSA